MIVEDGGARRSPPLAVALRKQWRIALLPVVLLVVVGFIWALLTPVQYVAQAQLIAGATSVNAAAVPSFTEAGRALAETYSRVFSGDQVQDEVSVHLGGVKPQVSASPVPGSSIILVEARAGSAAEAVRIADAGVDALTSVVADLLDNDEAVSEARARLGEAQRELAEAEARLGTAQENSVGPAVIQDARAAVSTARANVDAHDALLTQVVSNSVQSNGVQRLSSAVVTSDTSMQRFQLRVVLGLIAGCVVGVCLAYLRVSTRRQEDQRR